MRHYKALMRIKLPLIFLYLVNSIVGLRNCPHAAWRVAGQVAGPIMCSIIRVEFPNFGKQLLQLSFPFPYDTQMTIPTQRWPLLVKLSLL